jgi:hypothetical protein
VPEPPRLVKAELRELDASFKKEASPPKHVAVQFNPETLKVSFANQINQPANGGDRRGQPNRQFVGAGTTKLALQLWFDVSAPPHARPGTPVGQQQTKDVRKLTEQVAYFITPKTASGQSANTGAGADPMPEGTQLSPPAVRFLWGSFLFDGMMDSLEENLELWSAEGLPLRANVAVALSAQRIIFAYNPDAGRAGSGAAPGASPGTAPLAQTPAGATVQGLADAVGSGGSWQSIAAANGIENPRQLAPGQLIDQNARTPSLSLGFDAGVGA